jgi:predicted peptidase
MKKKFVVPVILLLTAISIFSFSSCNKDETPPPPTPRSYQDLENDFNAIDISDGIIDVSLKASDLLTWDVRIISPGIVDGETYPLVFTLHGAANGSPTAHQATACLAEPGLESLGAIIVSPNGYLYQWYQSPNVTQVMTLIDLAKKYWPVDTNRIAVTGYSNGGNGSWFFAEVFPETFSAAIPMASSYNTYDNNGDPRYIETPLYVIHGENDELFPVDSTQNWVNATQSAGTEVIFVIAPGLTHPEPCEYVSYLQDAALWLQNDIWN